MIRADRVSKWFGSVHAVRDLSLDIPSGQVVGLLGPNGAGKTTTIRMIAGYLPPTRGGISVCGYDTVSDSLKARRLIGYLPEAAPLYPEMRVREYLDYRGRLYGLDRRTRRDSMASAMERCELGDPGSTTGVAGRRIGTLSKGFKQRVGLAAAVLHNPPVVILDEPTSGLDPSQVRHTRALLRELAANRTVLVSSHILPEIERTCDRVVVIARGRIRADGSPAELLAGLISQARYFVELQVDRTDRAPLDQWRAAFAAIAGVRAVEALWIEADEASRAAGWGRFVVTAGPEAPDLRERIARVASRAPCVREIRREQPSLEQLFMRVIEDSADAGEKAGASAVAGDAAENDRTGGHGAGGGGVGGRE